jgi:outer membrane protein
MKNSRLAFFALLLCVTYAQAQTTQGSMMVGGTLSLSKQTPEDNNDTQFSSTNFSPSFGYFVTDNLAVGAGLGFTSQTSKNPTFKSVNSSIGFGPFARYYKFTTNENFAFFGHAQIMLYSGKTETTSGATTNKSKNSTTSFSISPGFSYFMTKHWALDLSITGFVFQSNDPNKDDDDDKETSVVFGLSSLSPNLGLRYHFGN